MQKEHDQIRLSFVGCASTALTPLENVSRMTTSLHMREKVTVLITARAVYEVLALLQPGDSVPELCYILDYRNGEIPLWEVLQRDQDDELIILVLINRDTLQETTPLQWVARQVLALPAKILASPPYILSPDGGEPRPILCDLIQQARSVAHSYSASSFLCRG